jgi:SAM-dependent methyltransferase
MRWTGNTGKARIQRDLLAIDSPISIIDIGAVGPGPLDLWKDMPLENLAMRVVAVDPDAEAVQKARSLDLPIELHAVSGYDLAEHLPAQSFDIGICTQVLEHVARPVELLSAIRHVLKAGALLWLTVDSAHFAEGHHGDPLWKRWARPWAARVSERFYDFGLTEDGLVECLTEAGFEVRELMHCNLSCLKPLYAGLDDDDAKDFMPAWLTFERDLASRGFSNRALFRGIYAAAQRK